MEHFTKIYKLLQRIGKSVQGTFHKIFTKYQKGSGNLFNACFTKCLQITGKTQLNSPRNFSQNVYKILQRVSALSKEHFTKCLLLYKAIKICYCCKKSCYQILTVFCELCVNTFAIRFVQIYFCKIELQAKVCNLSNDFPTQCTDLYIII